MKITDGRTPLAQHCNVVAAFAATDKMLPKRAKFFRETGDGLSISNLIFCMFEAGQEISIKEIIRALPDKKRNSLTKAVSDLIAGGLLKRVRLGVYRKI